MASESTTIGMRIPDDRLAEIDRLARGEGLTRTAYMIQCALSPHRPAALLRRIDDIERRLDRIDPPA